MIQPTTPMMEEQTDSSKYYQTLQLLDDRRDMSQRHAIERAKAVSRGSVKVRHAREMAELEAKIKAKHSLTIWTR